mmetsp:Transcript_16036/g.22841  ORF Transcript_16036/g.22841 Transcript_16036/m.22841 type:complete len:148 (-) Transcript_16036:409-852(-)
MQDAKVNSEITIPASKTNEVYQTQDDGGSKASTGKGSVHSAISGIKQYQKYMAEKNSRKFVNPHQRLKYKERMLMDEIACTTRNFRKLESFALKKQISVKKMEARLEQTEAKCNALRMMLINAEEEIRSLQSENENLTIGKAATSDF